MGEEEDVGGGVDINAVVSNDNWQEQHIDDAKSDEALQKNLVKFSINPNPLPWSHFCQNNFIFLFKGWNKCQKNLGKFDFYFFYI